MGPSAGNKTFGSVEHRPSLKIWITIIASTLDDFQHTIISYTTPHRFYRYWWETVKDNFSKDSSPRANSSKTNSSRTNSSRTNSFRDNSPTTNSRVTYLQHWQLIQVCFGKLRWNNRPLICLRREHLSIVVNLTRFKDGGRRIRWLWEREVFSQTEIRTPLATELTLKR